MQCIILWKFIYPSNSLYFYQYFRYTGAYNILLCIRNLNAQRVSHFDLRHSLTVCFALEQPLTVSDFHPRLTTLWRSLHGFCTFH